MLDHGDISESSWAVHTILGPSLGGFYLWWVNISSYGALTPSHFGVPLWGTEWGFILALIEKSQYRRHMAYARIWGEKPQGRTCGKSAKAHTELAIVIAGATGESPCLEVLL